MLFAMIVAINIYLSTNDHYGVMLRLVSGDVVGDIIKLLVPRPPVV